MSLPDKKALALKSGLTTKQVSNWINYHKNQADSLKSKRLNALQLKLLLEFFKNNSKPSKDEIAELSEKTNIPVLKIKRWFYRKRFCDRIKIYGHE